MKAGAQGSRRTSFVAVAEPDRGGHVLHGFLESPRTKTAVNEKHCHSVSTLLG